MEAGQKFKSRGAQHCSIVQLWYRSLDVKDPSCWRLPLWSSCKSKQRRTCSPCVLCQFLKRTALRSKAHLPVDTRSRESGSHTTWSEAVVLEVLDVPWLDTCGSQQDAATDLQGTVQSSGLLRCSIFLGVEPVHWIHHLWCACERESRRAVTEHPALTTAMVKLPGLMRAMTSSSPSVWIRRPSKAPGADSLTWALGVKYVGWQLDPVS